jgi:ribosome-associated protein
MSRSLKEEVLSAEMQAASVGSGREETAASIDRAADLDERILRVLHSATEKKAVDLTVLDLRGVATFTDFFVIATGANKRQVQAIADEVVEQSKKHGTRAARVEGYQSAEWILVDYGDFVVHVFDDRARRFYDLERLWRLARRVHVPLEQVEQIGSLRKES